MTSMLKLAKRGCDRMAASTARAEAAAVTRPGPL
jgi:hypothetical protein